MQAARSSETLVSSYKSIRHYFPEDRHRHFIGTKNGEKWNTYFISKTRTLSLLCLFPVASNNTLSVEYVLKRVRPDNTLTNHVICLTFVVQWNSTHWNTAEPIIYNASLDSYSKPGVVSQLTVAYARAHTDTTMGLAVDLMNNVYFQKKGIISAELGTECWW
jgi:hypothetical protein